MIADMSTAAGAKSRRGPLFWVLTGGAVFLLLLFGTIIFVAQHSGQEQPQRENRQEAILASMRKMVPAGPNIEVLEENIDALRIVYRDKKTGKKFLIQAEPTTGQIKTIPVPDDPAEVPSK